MKTTNTSNVNRSRHFVWKLSDFTIHDYANSSDSVKSARLKKGSMATQNLQVVKKDSSELDWYDKDLSDFSDVDVTFSDNEADSTVLESRSTKKSTRRRRRRLSSEHEGLVYPIDMWFLIGEHVEPQDVQRFAAICQATHIVSHTARFWLNMYRRLLTRAHADAVNSLPYELSTSSLNNLHGLQARVVRAMFVLHPPFVHRLQRASVTHSDTDVLVNLRCWLAWTQEQQRSPRGQAMWNVCLKFRPSTMKTCQFVGKDRRAAKRQRDIFGPDNIHQNGEEGCYILQVTTDTYVPIPLVMGQVLVHAGLRIGSSMRHEKLEMRFSHSCDHSSTTRPSSGSSQHVLTVDPVFKIQIFPWWSPLYYSTQQMFECEWENV